MRTFFILISDYDYFFENTSLEYSPFPCGISITTFPFSKYPSVESPFCSFTLKTSLLVVALKVANGEETV
ncbi:hypothetical protein J3D55_001097 [Chryseobacterium ginsenosidimutans]|nr:hypothetical protein [Chryseobacterium ginsenosidimutans]